MDIAQSHVMARFTLSEVKQSITNAFLNWKCTAKMAKIVGYR